VVPVTAMRPAPLSADKVARPDLREPLAARPRSAQAQPAVLPPEGLVLAVVQAAAGNTLTLKKTPKRPRRPSIRPPEG